MDHRYIFLFLLFFILAPNLYTSNGFNVSGGHAYSLNLTMISQTNKWFLASGNMSTSGFNNITCSAGQICALNINLTISSSAYLLLSTNPLFNSDNLNNANPTYVDVVFFMGSTDDADSANNTFIYTQDYEGTDYTNVYSVDTNKYSSESSIPEGILVDNNANIVFITKLYTPKVNNFNHEPINFQVMLPVNHSHGSETYYFKIISNISVAPPLPKKHRKIATVITYVYNYSSKYITVFINDIHANPIPSGILRVISAYTYTTHMYNFSNGTITFPLEYGKYALFYAGSLKYYPAYAYVDVSYNQTIPLNNCVSNDDCAYNQFCSGEHICVDLPVGLCGHIFNHTWMYYECCNDSMCSANETCIDHACYHPRTYESKIVYGNFTKPKQNLQNQVISKLTNRECYIPMGILILLLLYLIYKYTRE